LPVPIARIENVPSLFCLKSLPSILHSECILYRTSCNFISVHQALIPEAIPRQKYHTKEFDSQRLRRYGYLKCIMRGRVHKQGSAPVAPQVANSAARLCRRTCRYIIKRLTGDIYAGFLQNELPALEEDVPLRTRLQMYYQHDGASPDVTRNVT